MVADCAVFGASMAAKISGVPCVTLMPTVFVPATPHPVQGATESTETSTGSPG
jgi:hypothetical protein